MEILLKIVDIFIKILDILPGIKKAVLWIRTKTQFETIEEREVSRLVEEARRFIAENIKIICRDDVVRMLTGKLMLIDSKYKSTMLNKVHIEVSNLLESIVIIYKAAPENIIVSVARMTEVLMNLVRDISKEQFLELLKKITPHRDFASLICNQIDYPGRVYGELMNPFIMRINKERAKINNDEANIYDSFLAYIILSPWKYVEYLRCILQNNSVYKFSVISKLLCKAMDSDYTSKLWSRDNGMEPDYGVGMMWEVFDLFNNYVEDDMKDRKKDRDVGKYFDLALSLRCLPQSVAGRFKGIYPGRVLE